MKYPSKLIPLALCALATLTLACDEKAQTAAQYFDEQTAAYCRASRACDDFGGTQAECLDYYADGDDTVSEYGETCTLNLASYRECWASVRDDSCSASLDECSNEWDAWLDCVE